MDAGAYMTVTRAVTFADIRTRIRNGFTIIFIARGLRDAPTTVRYQKSIDDREFTDPCTI